MTKTTKAKRCSWKDAEYSESLPADVRDALPPRPVDADQLNDEQRALAAGAGWRGAVGGAITGGFAVAGPGGAALGALGGGLAGSE